MTFHIVIPTRLQSTRLPGKLLLDIAGKSMLQRVYEQASQSNAASITIASADDEILNVARHFGADICKTRVHENGTDRIAETTQHLKLPLDAIVVNVQADEPMIAPQLINQVGDILNHSQAQMATLYEAIAHVKEYLDPNVVKVVGNVREQALYFSRAPIPWLREAMNHETMHTAPFNHDFIFRHIGLYSYRVAFLREFVAFAPAPIEQIEFLEQLRVLYHGYSIQLAKACKPTVPGVDTQADLDYVRQLFLAAGVQ